mmetsp:Transcript_22826/g.49682  ORF Transcript_22826/g.49682 Transcript_22826/m.49682 type:complete len:304 (-) Transcript_22826:204-1115(-)
MRSIRRSHLATIIGTLGCFRPISVWSYAPLFAGAAKKISIFRSFGPNRFSSSSLLSSPTDGTPRTTMEPLKVLALHGSGGTADDFPKQLDALNKALAFHSSNSDDDDDDEVNSNKLLQLEITAVQAPFVKNDGFSWWTMPPGVRSFNAKEYTGFEESSKKVLDVWENGGFDIVIGHSQGAILVGALLALNRTPYHPPGGYIMNGVSFPNPYTKELESLQNSHATDNDGRNGSVPNILFLLGRRDQIAPNATGEKLRGLLEKGGFEATSCYHDGGHGFPREAVGDEAMKTIAEWILTQQRRRQS